MPKASSHGSVAQSARVDDGPRTPGKEADDQLLRQFTRTVAEMEWLVLLVAILYVLVNKRSAMNGEFLAGCSLFTAFFTTFHYANFFRRARAWKLAIETWAIIGFVTWLLLITGGLPNPLMSLYLVVILVSALSLGKRATLLEVVAIGACLLAVRVFQEGGVQWNLDTTVRFFSFLAPLFLVGYLASMLAASIKETHQHIQSFAETDPMTGLYNRRVFQVIAEHEYARAVRYSEPMTIIMIDLNQLKAVNDRHGHAAGDQLIKVVAETLEICMRSADTLARYAGDEFVLLLPQTSKKQGVHVANRLRRKVAARLIEAGDTKVSVTISVGVATFPADGSTVSDLMAAADQTMYLHKRLSRYGVDTELDENGKPRHTTAPAPAPEDKPDGVPRNPAPDP